MIINRIKFLIKRYIEAKRLGFKFFRAKNFIVPKSIILNDKFINLRLPNEHGVKMSFIDIFLDDVYKLKRIKKFSDKNNIKIKSILDIGGNCGLFSIAAREYFSKSTIHCYEPNLFIKKYLKYNSAAGNFKFFNESVGKNTCMVSLVIKKNNSVLSNIALNKNGSTPQISFNNVLKRFKFNTIDIVKMDCEGSEWEILNDIKTWKKVKFLTMEYHLGKNKYNHDRVVNVLNKIGFNLLSRIERSKKVNFGLILAYNRAFPYM